MGLIARALEDVGIATLSMSSARDITRAVAPPRSVFVDYKLGHTSGRPHDAELNLRIMRSTLRAFEALDVPGSMSHLPYRWADSDAWKDRVFTPRSASLGDDTASGDRGAYDDDRVARHDTPQYQSEADADAARVSHDGEECLVCAGIDY